VNVGYYDMSAEQGVSNQVQPIVTAGETPVTLFDLTAADLTDIDVLFVQNPDNFAFGAEYVSRLGAIETAVSNGMVLIIHDRYVTAAANILPDGAGFQFFRATSPDIDILDDTTLVTNGPGGILDDLSLDGGNFSSHGFVVAGSLPGDAASILSQTDPGEVVTFCYPSGSGAVIYSSIPLDFYLGGAGTQPTLAFRTIYAPNVVAYGAAGACGAGLSVSPGDGFVSLGFQGGPFAPSSRTYTLANSAGIPLDFSVTVTQPWLSLDDGNGPTDGPLNGTLLPGESRDVAVIIDADAQALPAGEFSDQITFTDVALGLTTSRTVVLQVRDGEMPQILLNGGFELGDFTGWTTETANQGRVDLNNGGFEPSCEGNFSAFLHQDGAGTSTLFQDVDLLPGFDVVTLNWTDTIRNLANRFEDRTQEFRVEIRGADPPDLFIFPATGDTRFTLTGNSFRNVGDFVEGVRTFTSSGVEVEMTLSIEDNFLTCDTQDHALMIDGATIGNFSVASGDIEVVERFALPVIAPGPHTIRIETTRTVSSGCGSAGFPNDVSTLDFGLVLSEVFATSPGDPLATDCTSRSFDISEFAEQSIRIAFVVNATLNDLDVQVDDVSLVLGHSNQTPTADAGADQSPECAGPGGALVTLDGSGSSDLDSTPGTNDDIVLFEWFEDFGLPTENFIASGSILTVPFSLGAHAVTLRATDTAGATDTDDVLIAVVDTTPPALAVAPFPQALWPPNHRIVQVEVAVTAEDACGSATVVLASVTSSEPDNATGKGDGNTIDDIQGADIGLADFELGLRAERAGTGEGRIYRMTYVATDAGGNETSSTGFAFVPHNQSGVTEPVMITVAEKPAGTALEWGDVWGAIYYNAVRGELSAIRELGNSIDLGAVTCLKSQSLEPHTSGWEDGALPGPGQGFFYVVEYFDGWRTSFGTASAAKPRHPAIGDCE